MAVASGLATLVSSLLCRAGLLTPSAVFASALFACLGAYVPDLDLKKAHRAALHNFVAMTLSTLLVLCTSMLLIPFHAVAATIGYLTGYSTHLLLDALTVKGVALAYPISRRRYRLTSLCTRSDDRGANVALQLLGALLIVMAFALLPLP